MAFDPDAHLEGDAGFDPDAHLSSDTAIDPSVQFDKQGRVSIPDQGYMQKYFGGILNAARKFKKEVKTNPGSSIVGAPMAVVDTVASPIVHVISDAAAVADNAINKIPGAQHLPRAMPDSTFAKQQEAYNQDFGNIADPQTPISKATGELVGSVFKPVGDALSLPGKATSWAAGLFGASPETQKSVEQQTNAVSNAALLGYGARKAAAKEVPPELQATQEQLNKQFSGKSAGAASTAPDISKTPTEFQQEIAEGIRKGMEPNAESLARQVRAQSLPVPIKLTEGQASGNPAKISEEMNNRGKFPQYAQRFQEQNKALVENIQMIREEAGPDVFSTNPVEHGDTLISAYKDKAAIANADISAKYQALRDANGGQFPVDAPTLLQNATDALHKDLLFDHAPPAVMRTLNRLSDANNMSFENFESLRTNLATIQRTATDGNERRAAGVIRNAMENMPLKLFDAKADIGRKITKSLTNADEYSDYGIRIIPNDQVVKKGDSINNSYEWSDGNITNSELPGVSTIGLKGLSNADIEKALSIILPNHAKGWGGYYGKQIAIIKGTLKGAGEDIGEHIIGGSVVHDVFPYNYSNFVNEKQNISKLKELADQARTAARAQFQALEADPAYKAAVSDSVPSDRFVHKFLVSAPRDSVAKMAENFANNELAKQTMGVAVIDHLKDAAGIDRQGNGNFSQAGFNKNFEKLDPKLGFVLPPKTLSTMQDLGAASRDIMFQPKGSFVNNSNTLTGALAEGAKGSIEGAANVAFGGVPVGTWVRKAASKSKDAAATNKALAPAAGVFENKKLSELLKPPKK